MKWILKCPWRIRGALLFVLGFCFFGAASSLALSEKGPGLEEALQRAAAAPRNFEAQAALARAYNFEGEYGKAASAAREALLLKPGHPPALLELGHASRSRGNHRHAVECYRRYLSACPSSQEGLAGCSESLAFLGQWDESFGCAMAAIRVYPGNASGYGALGRAYRISGRVDEALEILQKGLLLPGDAAPLLFDLGACFAEKGNRVAALEQYARLADMDPMAAGKLFRLIGP